MRSLLAGGRHGGAAASPWPRQHTRPRRLRRASRSAAAACRAHVRPLLLDNYDSYTFNLYQIIAEAYGVDPLVLRNDEVDIATIQQLLSAGHIHHIILSPGPGTPHNPKDIGVCMDVLRDCPSTPVLGVCLGQQAMAVAAGGNVVRAPEPVHGRLSTLKHNGHELFANCPSGPGSGLDVVRYHSLVVEAASLPSELEPLAWTCGGHQAVSLCDSELSATGADAAAAAGGPDRLIMALRHKQRPHYGVQFHPESVATRYGVQLLLNFRDIACRHSGHTLQQRQHSHVQQQLNPVGPPGRELPARPWPTASAGVAAAAAAMTTAAADGSTTSSGTLQGQQQQQPQVDLSGLAPASCVGAGGLQLLWQRLPGAAAAVSGGSASLFSELVGPGPDTFWLDSSSAPERARFSFMGGPGLGTGPLWRQVTYKLPPPPAAAAAAVQGCGAAADTQQPGTLSITSNGVCSSTHTQQQQQVAQASVFDYLHSQMQRLQLQPECAAAAAAELPFNFWGGFVGYFGYELKAECGGANAHAAPGPDAAWLFADRLLVVDHELGDVWLLALAAATPPAAEAGVSTGEAAAGLAAQQWLASTASRVQRLAVILQSQPQPHSNSRSVSVSSVSASCAQLRHDRAAYVDNVAACKESLVAGDSYELCLTTSYTVDGTHGTQQPPESWQFYSTLRSINPAPYSAWLSVAASAAAPGVTVCCSSPERFLSCGRGGVLEAKPIKGTARRHPGDAAADLAAAAGLLASEKERAENLMIVDLLRNDLGRVCEAGSVHVPGLIQLESYSSVHQLVSTVRGLMRPDASCVQAVRAAFPGGSMTGAPKVRSMEILDELEQGPRGVYSGALGYLSVNDTFDLNIVIRTAVFVEPQQQAGHATADRSMNGSSSSSRVMTIGAGGAVTIQSDPQAEFAEMQLKAERLLVAAALAVQQQIHKQPQQPKQQPEERSYLSADSVRQVPCSSTPAARQQVREPVRR